jgi:hypothetical protein
MWQLRRALFLASIALSACASPYFVNDPQGFIISRTEVPHLIKALRCELATYIAANNQRHVIFKALANSGNLAEAIKDYPYFNLDVGSFGGIALDLKVQDSLGLQSGTQFDYKHASSKTHTLSINIGPTASDQSTYEAIWNFIIPQDTYYLDNVDFVHAIPIYDTGNVLPPDKSPFSCYKSIPLNPNPRFLSPAASQDLDNLALGKYSELENYKRVWVDGTTPLAAWLEMVSTELGRTTFLTTNPSEREAISPAQMFYIFTIQVTGGIDVKYLLTSSVWSALGPEISGGMQQTNTMTLVLNGLEAQLASAVKGGNVKNSEANPMPVITVAVKKKQQPTETGPGGPPPVAPRTNANVLPPYVNRDRSRGTLTYPVPLSPLGLPNQ